MNILSFANRFIIALAGALVLMGCAKQIPVDPDVSEAVMPFIEVREVSGAVTLVADAKSIRHLDAAGSSDLETFTPMRTDSIFWIASMSKPVTAAAVLMMQDQGKLSITDPVSKYIPELAGLKTADGATAPITIQQLLTHTSGMADATPEETKYAHTLSAMIPVYARKPLNFVPGSRWSYCQSSINTAARVVEIVSGESFDVFLENHFFRPMEMKDTTFYLSSSQFGRLAKSYSRTAARTLEPAQNFILQGRRPTDCDRFPAANGGLFSTAEDYARFCQMLLNNGKFHGHEYLKPESVRLMNTVLTGELSTGFTPGNGWGLGCCVVRKPQGATEALSAGSFGHGGAFGTQAWIDPVKGRIYILMVQRSNFPNADASDLRKAFQQTAAR